MKKKSLGNEIWTKVCFVIREGVVVCRVPKGGEERAGEEARCSGGSFSCKELSAFNKRKARMVRIWGGESNLDGRTFRGVGGGQNMQDFLLYVSKAGVIDVTSSCRRVQGCEHLTGQLHNTFPAAPQEKACRHARRGSEMPRVPLECNRNRLQPGVLYVCNTFRPNGS